jgi:hypothetical protein
MRKQVLVDKYYCNYCKRELFLYDNIEYLYDRVDLENAVWGIIKISKKKGIEACTPSHEKFYKLKRHICFNCFQKDAKIFKLLKKQQERNK